MEPFKDLRLELAEQAAIGENPMQCDRFIVGLEGREGLQNVPSNLAAKHQNQSRKCISGA